MPMQRNSSTRTWLTALVALAQAAHLGWDHLHGGIPSHHLLNRADLPAVSNAWGLVLLPMLAWWLVGRIQARLGRAAADGDRTGRARSRVAIGFAGSAIVGIALSIAFTQGAESVASVVFFGTLATALVLPVYRAECVLGFVLAMAFTFGPVLPVLIGGVIAAVSYASTVYLFGAMRWGVAAIRRGSGVRPARG